MKESSTKFWAKESDLSLLKRTRPKLTMFNVRKETCLTVTTRSVRPRVRRAVRHVASILIESPRVNNHQRWLLMKTIAFRPMRTRSAVVKQVKIERLSKGTSCEKSVHPSAGASNAYDFRKCI